MQVQMSALREAFSADTSKPFELKASLGLRSPAFGNAPTPPHLQHAPHSAPAQSTPVWPHIHDTASSKTMSPASEYATPLDIASTHSFTSQPTMAYHSNSYHIPATTAYANQTLHQVSSAPQMGYALEPSISNESQTTPVWDPSGIFNQWNTAFGGTAPLPPVVSVSDAQMAPTSHPILAAQPVSQNALPNVYDTQHLPQTTLPVVTESIPTLPTVTPVMWQDAFTSAYVSGHGQKRYRQEDLDASAYSQYKRRG